MKPALDIGNGSQVTINGDAFVGRQGSATLNVHDNASFTSGNFFLGEQSAGTAQMNVTNTSTASFQQLNVGYSGMGTLSVSGQSTMTSDGTSIGENEDSEGTINIGQAAEGDTDASDGQWINGDNLIVGNAGTGFLNINTPGSSISTDGLSIGAAPGGVGTMTMNGGTLIVNDIAYVGEDGTGTLNLNLGALVYASDMSVGSDVNPDGAMGTVNVNGSGTFLTVTDTLLVGQGDTTGSIVVSSSGVLTSNETNIGQDGQSIGSISFTTGSFGALGNTYVGLNGNGALSIDDSAVTASALYVGDTENSSGLLTLSGPYGFLTVSGNLFVGLESESAALRMSGGANLEAANIYIGEFDGTGTFTVTGSADEDGNPLGLAHADGTLSVGGSGTGIMDISDGAQVVAGNTVVGRELGGVGTLSIIGTDGEEDEDGNSVGGPQPHLWAGDLVVGLAGTGTFSVTAGGLLDADSLTIGSITDGIGTMTADGTNTLVNINGASIIGDQGNAMLTVSGGAVMTNIDAFVAQSAGSTSSVTVTGEGSTWHSTGSLYIGGSTDQAGGNGTVTVETGGSVIVDGNIILWNTGELDIPGGTVTAAGLDLQGGIVSITDNGQLNVPGTLTVANSGRVNFYHGKTTVGSLTISTGGIVNMNALLAVNYGSSANNPVAAIAAYLRSGYSGGTWTGTAGIISTMAAGSVSPILSVGYADGNTDPGTAAAPNQVLIKLTLAGDTNLDGNVDFNDLFAVGKRLNTTGNDWASGNFNYSTIGAVDFNDLFIIGQNLNKTINTINSSTVTVGSPVALGLATVVQSTTALPEPGVALLAAMAGSSLLARKRRNKTTSIC